MATAVYDRVRSQTSVGTEWRPAMLDMAQKVDQVLALLNALIAATDLSGLPTSDPGGGKPWLNGGILQVGP